MGVRAAGGHRPGGTRAARARLVRGGVRRGRPRGDRRARAPVSRRARGRALRLPRRRTHRLPRRRLLLRPARCDPLGDALSLRVAGVPGSRRAPAARTRGDRDTAFGPNHLACCHDLIAGAVGFPREVELLVQPRVLVLVDDELPLLLGKAIVGFAHDQRTR